MHSSPNNYTDESFEPIYSKMAAIITEMFFLCQTQDDLSPSNITNFSRTGIQSSILNAKGRNNIKKHLVRSTEKFALKDFMWLLFDEIIFSLSFKYEINSLLMAEILGVFISIMTRYKDNEKYIKNKEILDATQKLMEETNRSLGRYGIHVVATGCPEPAPPLRAAEKAYGSYGIEKNVYDLAHGLLSRLFPEFTTPPLDQRYRKWDGAFIEKVAGLINRYETDLPSYVRKASKYAKKHKFHKSGIPGGSSISAQAVMTDSQKSIDPPKQLTAHHPMKKYILLAATGACVFAYLLNSLDVISIASDAVMIPILFIAFLILMMYLLLPVPAVKSFNKNYENSYRTISKLVSEDNQACTMLVLEAWSQVTKQPIDELITSNLCNNRPQNVNRKSHEFNQNRSPQTSVTALKTKLG